PPSRSSTPRRSPRCGRSTGGSGSCTPSPSTRTACSAPPAAPAGRSPSGTWTTDPERAMRILQNTSTPPVPFVALRGGRLVAGGSGGFDIYTRPDGERRHIPASGATAPWPVCAVDPRGRWFCTTDWKKGCRLLPLGEDGAVGRLPGAAEDQKSTAFALS